MRRLDVPADGNLCSYYLRKLWRDYWESEIVPTIVWEPTPIDFAKIEWPRATDADMAAI
jgi:hypothetical protein